MNPKTVSFMKEYTKKLDKIEKDLLKLKTEGVSVCLNALGLPKRTISLKGILKGITITEKDIEQAKKSLFKGVKI